MKYSDNIPFNVRIRVYDTDILRFIYPEWDALNKKEKYFLLDNTGPEVFERIETHNTTCIDLHKYLSKNIDPNQSVDESADLMAFGDDDSVFDSSHTELNNQLGTVEIVDTTYDENVPKTIFSGFIDSTEMANEDLREAGIIGSGGRLWNHVQISPEIDKTTSETVVVDIDISFSDNQ